MATTIITLTDTFQQVAAGQCFAQPNGNLLYGFGSSTPTVSHVFNPSLSNEAINYNGDFGAMWMKNSSTNNVVSVIVTVV